MSNKPDKETLLKYLKEKLTYTEIAKRHNVKQTNSVKKWYKSYNIDLPKRKSYNGHNSKRIINKPCLYCGTPVNKINQGRKKYCSSQCQMDYQYQQYIIRWKSGQESGVIGKVDISGHLRRYLFEKYNNKCCKCDWNKVNPHTGKIPLQVNHIDGNCLNNTEDNLELICPNCHSLTSTWGGANKTKGRRRILQEKREVS